MAAPIATLQMGAIRGMRSSGDREFMSRDRLGRTADREILERSGRSAFTMRHELAGSFALDAYLGTVLKDLVRPEWQDTALDGMD
jgi:hypothetical protein